MSDLTSDERVRVLKVGTRKSQPAASSAKDKTYLTTIPKMAFAEDHRTHLQDHQVKLAMIQTESVVHSLQSLLGSTISCEVVARTTLGDQRLEVALNKIGEKSLFTKELENSLENREVDLVVHSLKDLPTTLPEGMVIGAIIEREDPRDALVMSSGSSFASLSTLPEGAVVGTSSVRRAAQIRSFFPSLVIKDVRGNLNTRLRKLDDESEGYDALVLAAAGMIRMGWKDRITQILPCSKCLHAVGQGALAVECRADDISILKVISPLNHRQTALASVAERSFMHTLQGGCSAPVAAHAKIKNEELTIEGAVWSLNGDQTRRGTLSKCLKNLERREGPGFEVFSSLAAEGEDWKSELAAAESAGKELAERLLDQGAGEILAEAKRQNAQ